MKKRYYNPHSAPPSAREGQVLRIFQATRELNRWSHTDFDCEKDAKESLARWEKKLKYHALEGITITSTRVCRYDLDELPFYQKISPKDFSFPG